MGSEQIRPFLTRIIMGPQPRSRPFSAFWNARSEILTWEGAISMATTTAFLFPDRPAWAVPFKVPRIMMFPLADTLAPQSTSPMTTMLASDSRTSRLQKLCKGKGRIQVHRHPGLISLYDHWVLHERSLLFTIKVPDPLASVSDLHIGNVQSAVV